MKERCESPGANDTMVGTYTMILTVSLGLWQITNERTIEVL
jgi:hypothetical protein